MSSFDTEYYRQRAVDARSLMLDPERCEVVAIHQELARQKRALVDRAELQPTGGTAFPQRASA